MSSADLGIREDSVGCMSTKVILTEEKPGLMEQSEKCGALSSLVSCILPVIKFKKDGLKPGRWREVTWIFGAVGSLTIEMSQNSRLCSKMKPVRFNCY